MASRKENPNSKWTNKGKQLNGGYSNAHREEITSIKPKQTSIDDFEIESRMPGKKNPRVKPNHYYGTPPEYTI